MKIAVLAVQGAFIEHEKALQRLGAETVELRKAEDLEQDFDGLVLPGGESTVQSRLLKELSITLSNQYYLYSQYCQSTSPTNRQDNVKNKH